MGRPKANFFQRILWKLHIKRPNHHLTQEDRANALNLKQKRAKIKLKILQLEEQELDKELLIGSEISPEEQINKKINQAILTVIDNFMVGGMTKIAGSKKKIIKGSAEVKDPQRELPKFEEISETEIKESIKQVDPKVIQFLKGKKDAELQQLAQDKLGYSGANVKTAIKVLREWDC